MSYTRARRRPLAERPTRALALRELRLGAGMTQAGLAAVSGVDQSTLSKYESGFLKVTDAAWTYLVAAIGGAR